MQELGIMVPIVTPCSLEGEIDFGGLKSVVSYVLDAGCQSIYVSSSTGRGPWFSVEQRRKICECVANYVSKDVKIFAGCMSPSFKDMIENAKVVKESGADYAVFTAPGYFLYNQEEIRDIFIEIADVSPLPVLIYDIPVFSGVKLSSEIILKLSKHENVIGLKDSSGDMESFKKNYNSVLSNDKFMLLQGKENLLAESIEMGCSGFVVSLLHINPQIFVKLYKYAKSGMKNEAESIQKIINQLLDLINSCFKRRPETSTLFHILNYALSKKSVCKNILLEHEKDCPEWLNENTLRCIELLEKSI
jgi:dihydrodipicolinate synthase/N-acetylneuraminate lyase